MWLVGEAEGLTVMKTATPRWRKGILSAAESLGGRMARIVLTHAHGDHIGSLDELAAKVPEAEVLISTRDARLLKKDMSLDAGEPDSKLSGSYPGESQATHDKGSGVE